MAEQQVRILTSADDQTQLDKAPEGGGSYGRKRSLAEQLTRQLTLFHYITTGYSRKGAEDHAPL